MTSRSAYAVLRNAPVSVQKLLPLSRSIQGKPIDVALKILTFTRTGAGKAAPLLKKLLCSSIANAENNHNLNLDYLVVKQVSVGRGPFFKKRVDIKGRGRAGRILKPLTHVKIVVEEETVVGNKEG